MYNITVFVIDLNNHLSRELKKASLVERMKLKAKEVGVPFKIFTPEDEIVKDCYKEFEHYFQLIDKKIKSEEHKFAYISDVVRNYILSKNKFYFYLDTDCWIKDFNFLKKLNKKGGAPYFSFLCLFSGENLELFKNMLIIYKSRENELPVDDFYMITEYEKKYNNSYIMKKNNTNLIFKNILHIKFIEKKINRMFVLTKNKKINKFFFGKQQEIFLLNKKIKNKKYTKEILLGECLVFTNSQIKNNLFVNYKNKIFSNNLKKSKKLLEELFPSIELIEV